MFNFAGENWIVPRALRLKNPVLLGTTAKK